MLIVGNHLRPRIPVLRHSFRRSYSLYDQILQQFNVLEDTAIDLNRVRIDSYGAEGFSTNGVFHEGSLICLSNFVLKWSPKTFSEITPERLSLFKLLRPAPDILVLGCGRKLEQVSPQLRDFLRSSGIKIEASNSATAASIFNVLNEEGRLVAAALLPYGAQKE